MSIFQYIQSSHLAHNADCELLGIQPDMTLYMREYHEDDEATIHLMNIESAVTKSWDENDVSAQNALPADLIQPTQPRFSTALNYAGPRHRGMREAERVMDIVKPLTIQTKMQVIQHLNMSIMPMALLGIAESSVLAEALLEQPGLCMVCRRIRLAYALPQIQIDAEKQPYDYDTITLYSAHIYDYAAHESEIAPDQVLSGLPGVTLKCPMDCLIYNHHLFISESGTTDYPAAVHVWRIQPA